MENQKHLINIIAAVAENGAIGYKNELLYRLPNDLKRFKQLTIGKTVIMGRRTYESLPNGALPERRNIVLSRTLKNGDLPHCEIYDSLQQALAHCATEEEIYVIGGGEVYQQAMPYASRLLLTLVKDSPTNADTFFPHYADPNQWKEESREEHAADEKHAFDYSFVVLVRI